MNLQIYPFLNVGLASVKCEWLEGLVKTAPKSRTAVTAATCKALLLLFLNKLCQIFAIMPIHDQSFHQNPLKRKVLQNLSHIINPESPKSLKLRLFDFNNMRGRGSLNSQICRQTRRKGPGGHSFY